MMFDFNSIKEVTLKGGAHASPEEGMCAMEMVAWFHGEPHSDRPKCTSPVLAAYVRTLNDRMPDEVRDRLLKPILPHLVGTVAPEHEQARAEALVWFVLRNQVPTALMAAGLTGEANAVASAPTLMDASAACAAAASAAHAARAAARVAAADDAACAAAHAAACAASVAATYAAYAAAHAAAYAGWDISIQALREAIDIAPQSSGFAADPVERHAALRELVKAGDTA